MNERISALCVEKRRRFVSGEAGQATVEYVLLVGLISIPMCYAALRLFQYAVYVVVMRVVAGFAGGGP